MCSRTHRWPAGPCFLLSYERQPKQPIHLPVDRQVCFDHCQSFNRKMVFRDNNFEIDSRKNPSVAAAVLTRLAPHLIFPKPEAESISARTIITHDGTTRERFEPSTSFFLVNLDPNF